MAIIKHVKPSKSGLVVRNPNNGLQPLPAEGQNVEWSPFWARLQRDGDIIVSDAKKAPVKKTTTGGGN